MTVERTNLSPSRSGARARSAAPTWRKLGAIASACLALASSGALTACDSSGESSGKDGAWAVPKSPTQPGSPNSRAYEVQALLFAGKGTWSTEVASLEQILDDHGVSYEKVTTSELDSFTMDDFARFGTLIFPGGSGGTQAGSLTKGTRLRIRKAVRELGLNYVGFCAGAWIAAAPDPGPSSDAEYGFGIVNAPVLDYYHPLEDSGVVFEIVTHSFADGRSREIPWYGGPVTMSGAGVVARYPNGEPAISEAWAGNGFVVVAATHPGISQEVRDDFGAYDSDGLDQDIAWELIQAAMNQAPLPAFK